MLDFLRSVPLSSWVLAFGFVVSTALLIWKLRAPGTAAAKVSGLRVAAAQLESWALVPLREIAPRTDTKVDDVALMFIEMLHREMLRAADAAPTPAAEPSPQAVSDLVKVEFATRGPQLSGPVRAGGQ